MKRNDYERILKLCENHWCEELTSGRIYISDFSPEYKQLSSNLEDAIERMGKRSC